MECWIEKGILRPRYQCHSCSYRIAIVHFHSFATRFIPDTQISLPPRSLSFTVVIVSGNRLKEVRDKFDHKDWVCPDNEYFRARSSDF